MKKKRERERELVNVYEINDAMLAHFGQAGLVQTPFISKNSGMHCVVLEE